MLDLKGAKSWGRLKNGPSASDGMEQRSKFGPSLRGPKAQIDVDLNSKNVKN